MSKKVFTISDKQDILIFGSQCNEMLRFMIRKDKVANTIDSIEDSIFMVKEVYKRLLNVDEIKVLGETE
jgi:hypothetical protein